MLAYCSSKEKITLFYIIILFYIIYFIKINIYLGKLKNQDPENFLQKVFYQEISKSNEGDTSPLLDIKT